MLFSSYELSGRTLRNRVVMAPMTRSRAIGNVPNDLMAEYYGQRAEAGLIITEGTAPSPNALGYPRIPGVFSAEQVAGWQKVTNAVHEKGGTIFLQIMHTGRVTHPDNLPEGGRALAPSAIPLTDTKMYVDGKGELEIPAPEEMTLEDIQHVIQEYRTAARNAIDAGFDGIEIHGANGYLVEQFINRGTNARTDTYGGSIENRTRFALEVAQAVIDEIGADKTGIRLSPYGVFNEVAIYDELDDTYAYLSSKLSELNLTYIHLVDHAAMGAPEVPISIKAKIRENFNGTLILSGGYDHDRAQSDLDAGNADLVAFGRPFISNPDLVTRMQTGAELSQPDFNSFYTPGPEGYIDYPVLQTS
ncbi:MAG: alkene reductase [Bacteroidota bacterium]